MKTNGKLSPNQRAFLAAYAECGTITAAAEAAKINRRQHHRWIEAGNGYQEAFAEARERAGDRLEEEARRRAVDGVPEPVFYKGKPVGAIRKYSDTLLIFLLKGARPEKYREMLHHTGQITFTVSEFYRALADRCLQRS